MDLNDFLGPEPTVINLRARDRWEAIDELIAQLVLTVKISPEDRESIAQAVKKREAAMSTGIGYQIGLPHASTPLVSHVIGAIGKSQHGLEFDALDGQPVKLVLLVLVPNGQFQRQLNTLANIAKLLHRQAFRDRLLGG